jgi:ATP-dependent Clp protease ATP-binding subunit ClpB
MQFDKFTIKTQEAVQQAQQIAMENGQQSIECGHLLQGMFNVDENVGLSMPTQR